MSSVQKHRVVLIACAVCLLISRASLAERCAEYAALADSDFTQPHQVCLDPGHGGPEAQKYGNNGDDAGAYGYEDSLSEQWVNLMVAFALRDSLYLWGSCPGHTVTGVIMTREDQTDIPYGVPGLRWRVTVANYANMGAPVNEFISIHHNGFPNPADQGTESFWSNSATTDSGATRDTTSKLARKVRMKVRYAFNADAECYECYKDRGARVQSFFVLRNSRPASALPRLRI